MTRTLTIRPEALLAARRALLRHEQAVSSVPVHAPDTGVTTALTREVFGRVAATTHTVAADLRLLADGLTKVVDEVAAVDGDVRSVLDLLRVRGLG